MIGVVLGGTSCDLLALGVHRRQLERLEVMLQEAPCSWSRSCSWHTPPPAGPDRRRRRSSRPGPLARCGRPSSEKNSTGWSARCSTIVRMLSGSITSMSRAYSTAPVSCGRENFSNSLSTRMYDRVPCALVGRLQPASEQGKALGQLPVLQGPGIIEAARLAFQQRQIVDRLEERSFPLPAALVPGHQPVLVDQPDFLHRGHHDQLRDGRTSRERSNRCSRTAPATANRPRLLRRAAPRTAAWAAAGRRPGLPGAVRPWGPAYHACAAGQIALAPLPQVVVEHLQRIDLGHGHQEVPPRKPSSRSTCPFSLGRRTRQKCSWNR